MKMTKVTVPCTYCGELVERSCQRKVVSCFTCKIKNREKAMINYRERHGLNKKKHD